jgi:PKD repeat protein
VTVNNVAPTLTVPPNQTINQGDTLSLTNIGQFTDPGFNNPLNIGGETSETFAFTIDWGDGTPLDTGPGTVDVPGNVGVLTSGSFDGAHTYTNPGVYTVSVTLSDDDGGMASGTFTVTVQNVAPTLTVSQDRVVNEGSLLSITDIGKFTDPALDSSETYTYSIDWGDGRPVDTGLATIDSPGTPGVPTIGSFDGAHTYADNGLYTVAVTLTDSNGGTSSGTFQVTVNNVAPTLTVPPNQTINQGDTLSLTNIGQFTDPGFDNPLNIGGETSETFAFTIDWGDGTPLDTGPGTIDVPGNVGVLTSGSFDGAHTYTNPGVYTVSVTLSDDDGGLASGTFTVTVQNTAPVVVAAPNQTVNEGSLLSVANIGTFTDSLVGQPQNYTFEINWGDGLPPATGPASVDAPGSHNAPTSGSFDGSHTYADNGLYTVTLTLHTPDGRSGSTTMQVTVNNVAPTLAPVGPDRLIPQGTSLSLPGLGQFTDPGFNNPLNVGGETSETFTYSINWGDGTQPSTGPGIVNVPGGVGRLTAGSFSGQHTFAATGIFTVTVRVFDDDGGSAFQSFTVISGVSPGSPIQLPPVHFSPSTTITGAGGGNLRSLLAVAGDRRALGQEQTSRIDLREFRVGVVAGAETRLVLRIVSPIGVEDKDHDQLLQVDVLDDLRKLFRRLPDGHYRIYQILPDGVERLVVDVVVRQGRSIDAEDEAEGAGGTTGDAVPAEQPAAIDADSPAGDAAEAARASWSHGWLAAAGYAAVSAPRRRLRENPSEHPAERPLSKARRLLKRLKIEVV